MTRTDPARVLWLASYPRSGNTWLRTILGWLVAPKDSIFTTVPSFNDVYPSDAPLHDLAGIPAVRLVKTHFGPDDPRMAACPDALAGAILIRRHPLDILLSGLNYAALRGKEGDFLNGQIKPVDQILADGEFGHYIDRFAQTDGLPWFHSLSGPLSTFSDRWRARCTGLPCHEIRYEDLVADPQAVVAGLARFLGLPDDPDRIAAVLEKADRKTQANGKFYWKRQAYNFRTMLSPGQIAAFEAAYPALARLGYAPEGSADPVFP